jgi:hypothetical protein
MGLEIVAVDVKDIAKQLFSPHEIPVSGRAPTIRDIGDQHQGAPDSRID